MTETNRLNSQEHTHQKAAGSMVYIGVGVEPRPVTVTEQTTAMRLAVEHGISGIVGECGGQAMCGTCHVKVHEEYLADFPEPSEDELDILEFVVTDRDPVRSRLSCQLQVTPQTTLVVDVPDSQY